MLKFWGHIEDVVRRIRPVQIAAAGIVILASVVAVMVLKDVDHYGRYIESMWLQRDYLVAWLVAILLGMLIVVLPVKDKLLLQSYWWAKVFVVLIFMLFYEGKYDVLDAYQYIRWDPTDSAFTVMQTNTMLVCWFASALMRLLDSYHAVKVIFAFIGLWGVYFTVRAAEIYLGERVRQFQLLLFFYPTILFWSSILGKEPLQFFGIGLLLYGYFRCMSSETNRGKDLLVMFLGILATVAIRKWYILPVGAMLTVGFWNRTGKIAKIATVLMVVMVINTTLLSFFKKSDDVTEIFEDFTETFAADGGSSQEVTMDLSSPMAIVKYLPYGAFTAVYRPLPFDINNAFALLAAVENCFLLYITYLALRRLRLRDFKQPLNLSLIVYVFTWSLLYAIPSSMNLGTAVRYKLGLLPVLLLVLVRILQTEKLNVAVAPQALQIKEEFSC